VSFYGSHFAEYRMNQNTKINPLRQRGPSFLMAVWVVLFIAVYLLFRPIKGDMFSHFVPVYSFLFLSFVLIWCAYAFLGTVIRTFAFRLSITVICVAVLSPVASYLYHGRLYYVKNAAEFGYDRILWITLDDSNVDEIDFAIGVASYGGNDELVDKLKEMKSRLDDR
jgi:hypothetical protein